MGDFVPVSRIGIGGAEDRAIVLPQIIHHDQELAVRRKANLVTGRADPVERDSPGVLTCGNDWVLPLRVLVELQESYWIEILLRIENDDAATEPHDRRRPSAFGMPNRAVCSTQGERGLARQRALLDEQLAHRHHFPINLVALGALVVI